MKIRKLIVLVLLSIALFGCDFIYENPVDDTDSSSDQDTDTSEPGPQCDPACQPGWKCISDQCVELVADEQAAPVAIATDDTHVYWANYGTFAAVEEYNGDGQIVRAAKDGSELTVLADDIFFPHSIAIDDTHVYWVDGDFSWGFRERLIRISKDGGTPELVTRPDFETQIKGLDLSASHIYWAHATDDVWSAFAIYEMPKDLSTTAAAVHQEAGPIYTLQVTADDLYWNTDLGDYQTGLRATPVSDPTQVIDLAVAEFIEAFAVNTTDIFWTVPVDAGHAVEILSKSPQDPGSTPTAVSELSGYIPRNLLADDTSIYWALYNTPQTETDGYTIFEAPIDTGTATLLLDGLGQDFDFTMDDTHLFVVNGNDVFKLEK